MYAMAKYKNIMKAISTNRSLVATGLAVCCALAAASYARAEAFDANDPLGDDVAQLVQWHSGTSAANDFCGAREESLFYVRHPRMYALFLVMHGAPGVGEEELDASLTSFDSLDAPHGSEHGLSPLLR
jgi:hypothetical protein